jgi:putative SOS response-associated peptidase YedK
VPSNTDMPCWLLGEDELEQWLTAPAAAALKLQRPLLDGSLSIVARGDREDAFISPPK